MKTSWVVAVLAVIDTLIKQQPLSLHKLAGIGAMALVPETLTADWQVLFFQLQHIVRTHFRNNQDNSLHRIQ